MAQSKPLPPLEELQAAFEYDPASGLFFRKNCYYKSKNGSVAGSLASTGYIEMCLNRQRFLAHRAAIYMHTEIDPYPLQVDHIDHNKTNNRLSNLRVGTHTQNAANREAKGWRLTAYGKYQARIRIKGNSVSLGNFDTCQEAEAVYQAKALEVRGEWCYYA